MSVLRLLLVFAVICSFLTTVEARKKKKKKAKKAPKNHEAVDADDETKFLDHPAVIQARKMSQLVKRQDVVSTCRYILFKEHKSWPEAQHGCKNIEWPFTHAGASLASVKSANENEEIHRLLQVAFGYKSQPKRYHHQNWVWVGLAKVLNNNVKIPKNQWGDFDGSEWEWQDGTHPDYSKWANSQPDQAKDRKMGFQHNVRINKKGYWDDSFAAKETPYVCNYCGKYIVVAEHVTWDHAQHLCETYGLTMAIVDSAEENKELAWAAELTFGPETEKKRWNDTNWIWLGTEQILDADGVGVKDGDGKDEWQHHDGSTLAWSPKWDRKHQPDNYVKKGGKLEETKVAFSRINTKWDDSFKNRKRPFACMCPNRACQV